MKLKHTKTLKRSSSFPKASKNSTFRRKAKIVRIGTTSNYKRVISYLIQNEEKETNLMIHATLKK